VPPGGVGRLFRLARGYLRTVVGRLQPDTLFEVHSPSMVAAVRGTDWIESYAGGTTEIFVANGRVLATGTVNRDGNWVLLNAREGVSFIAGAPHTPVVRWGQEKINRSSKRPACPDDRREATDQVLGNAAGPRCFLGNLDRLLCRR
jgi:hypothetical protein